MQNEDTKRVINVFNSIIEKVNEVRDLFPEMPKKIKIPHHNANDHLKIVKRIGGIIKNYNEDNAERKIKSVVSFLKGIENKYRNDKKE